MGGVCVCKYEKICIKYLRIYIFCSNEIYHDYFSQKIKRNVVMF